MRREWTWHHKSSGDSWATDHRGQSRARRKCIPSPHSHCPHWCLFKPASDTWRDYFSCWKKINKKNLLPLHPRLQCFKGARLPSAARGQTGTPSPQRLSTSYLPHPASLFLAVISTAVTHFLRLVSQRKPDGFTITASLQIREHFHGLDCRAEKKPNNNKRRCFPVKSTENIVQRAFWHNLVQNTFHLIHSICIHNQYPDLWRRLH